jgi:hypothetical protein
MMCALVLLVSTGALVTAQEAQPTQDPALQVPNDPTAPQPSGEEDATPTEPPAEADPADRATPEAVSGQDSDNQTTVTRSAQRADVASGPGFPAVLAHGLAYVTGDEVVWQVRETDMPAPDSARSTTSNAAIMLQRDGSSIIRNDVTGKRAKTDPGEAYFRAAGDGYTVMADGDESLVWTFELVSPDDVAIDAFYESPTLEDLSEGVYDMMLTRYVLAPGDNVDLPNHSGAALVMVSSGEIEVDAEGERSALEQRDGQTIDGDARVSNTSDSDAVFVYVYIGDEVDDASAGSAQEPTTSDTETDTATDETDDTSESETTATEGTLQEEAESGEGSSEEVVPETDEAGNYLTSIDVTADAEIYLIITVDGLTVFDGTLPAGASSGPVVGTNFEVYTSSGINTNFTNACGDYFKMGYEEGEATYFLTATESSCAP